MLWQDSEPRTSFRSSLAKCKGMTAFTVPARWTSNPLPIPTWSLNFHAGLRPQGMNWPKQSWAIRASDYLPLPTSQHLPMVTSIAHFITILTNVDSRPREDITKRPVFLSSFFFFFSTKQHKCTSYFLHSFNLIFSMHQSEQHISISYFFHSILFYYF